MSELGFSGVALKKRGYDLCLPVLSFCSRLICVELEQGGRQARRQGALPDCGDQDVAYSEDQSLGVSGEGPNVGFQKASCAETGRLMNARFLGEYDARLKSQAKRGG